MTRPFLLLAAMLAVGLLASEAAPPTRWFRVPLYVDSALVASDIVIGAPTILVGAPGDAVAPDSALGAARSLLAAARARDWEAFRGHASGGAQKQGVLRHVFDALAAQPADAEPILHVERWLGPIRYVEARVGDLEIGLPFRRIDGAFRVVELASSHPILQMLFAVTAHSRRGLGSLDCPEPKDALAVVIADEFGADDTGTPFTVHLRGEFGRWPLIHEAPGDAPASIAFLRRYTAEFLANDGFIERWSAASRPRLQRWWRETLDERNRGQERERMREEAPIAVTIIDAGPIDVVCTHSAQASGARQCRYVDADGAALVNFASATHFDGWMLGGSGLGLKRPLLERILEAHQASSAKAP